MNLIGRMFSSRGRVLGAGVLVAWLLAGCGNIFTPKHKVTVDAICAAGIAKPEGKSFRLVPRKSLLGPGQVNVGVLSACVGAALAHQGMFEAPAVAAADLIIEMNCAQEAATRIDPGMRETFLELSARPSGKRALDNTSEPEIWNVRVSIQGLSGRLEMALPLLSAVASSYVAMDTRVQTRIEVPQNNASIAAVREAALKTLEAKGVPTVPAGKTGS